MNIYLYSSINLLIERNIIKVTNEDYNSKFGKAVGLGLSSDSFYDIESVEIQNNVIIGCRIGIYYFITGTASYKDIKIYHNTIWMVDITPIWFAEPIGAPSNSELFNNFIYHKKKSQLSPKSIWNIGYNIFYNSEKVPNQYSDTESETSKAIKKMNLSEIFNNNNGECNYNNPNINITCFRPNSKIKMNIIHGGKKLKEGKKDFEGCDAGIQSRDQYAVIHNADLYAAVHLISDIVFIKGTQPRFNIFNLLFVQINDFHLLISPL